MAATSNSTTAAPAVSTLLTVALPDDLTRTIGATAATQHIAITVHRIALPSASSPKHLIVESWAAEILGVPSPIEYGAYREHP